MRSTFACLLLLLAAIAQCQDTFDKHGKTDAEILKMGAGPWTDFYTSKEGNSTASMTAAAEVYGEVAKSRNDGILQHLKDAKLKGQVLKLRKSLSDFASSTVDVAYCESGGGTMYNTMWASVSGVVEDLLYEILSDSGPKSKPMVTSKVRTQIALLRKQVEVLHKDDPKGIDFKYSDAKKAIAKLTANFDQTVSVARGMNRRQSDRILGFCLDQAKNANYDSPK